MSTETKVTHTPGPWKSGQFGVVTGSRHAEYVNGTAYAQVAMACMHELIDAQERDANARLMAAAPDLLSALEAIVTPSHSPETYSAAIAQARAAIRKARGEE